jgi:2-amino-4-hydroxy-6-hydroxymethyldihydropteridine diphosphokinase
MDARATAHLALGSNLGDREAHLEAGLRGLLARGPRLVRRSGLYLTEPVGGPPQDSYLNAAAELETTLSPEELLAACLDVERSLGRVRSVKNAPRTLDLDLLVFGAEVRGSATLTLPHPRLHLRRFVLVPLAEIAPGLRPPGLGASIEELLRRCPDRSSVLPYPKSSAA